MNEEYDGSKEEGYKAAVVLEISLQIMNNEDVKCLIPDSTLTEEEEERQEEEVEDGKRNDEVLDTTTDTEYS